MQLLAFAEGIQLAPDGTLFIHVALILIMIWVLNRTLYRPINKVLASREKNKGGRSGEAAEILSDVSEKDARYNRELLEARSQGYELIEKEQKTANAAREKELASVKAEVAERFEAGRDRIADDAKAAQAAIRTDADKIADSIAASILKG